MNGNAVYRARRLCASMQREPKRERGFGGFLLLAFIAGLMAAAGLVTFYRTDPVRSDNDRASADALAAAKAALIAYAVHREGATIANARPGELPCPDLNGDGLADPPCRTTSTLLGRLPWRTLGIPDPKDSAGETLWYALSPAFREWDSFPTGTAAASRYINSDTRGTLTVRAADGTTVLTNNAVAVIFAPGSPIGAQDRGSGTLTCTLTNAPGLARLCASNYLEGATGVAGANAAAGPFTAVTATAGVNDQLVYLTTGELIPVLEMRVGNELRALLEKYRKATEATCKCYPWADTWEYSGGIADIGQNRGRFPTEPFPYDWGTNGIPALPAWVAANDWQNLFWYSVSKQNSDGAGVGCRTCSDALMLSVDGKPMSALVISPGTPRDGLARLTSASRRDDVNLFFEDASNRDGADAAKCPDTGEIGGTPGVGSLKGALACDQYTMPTSKAYDRDRLFSIPGPAICKPGAKAIVDNAPCGWPTVSPTCLAALAQLDACTCIDAARAMTRPPCVNTLNPPQCQAAITTLKGCEA